MNYKQIYFKHFGYSEGDHIECEYKCNKPAVDIHHIEPRGMGGKKKNIDRIENLIALCLHHHECAEGRIKEHNITKEELKKIVLNR